VEHVEHVASGNAVNAATAPTRQHIAPQEAFCFACRLGTVHAPTVPLDELRRYGFNAVGLGRSRLCPFLAGIAAFGDRAPGFGTEVAGSLQVDSGKRAEREFARLAVVSVSDSP